MHPLPFIQGTGKHTALYVDGAPYLVRGGEIHNSSASDLSYMEKYVWPAYVRFHTNTLIAPVYWECLEPEEGMFDFSLVDGLLRQARERKQRLILLWFGLWKNSASTYVPGWVKRDPARFWYIQAQNGKTPRYFDAPVRILSPLCQAAVEADAGAFACLMEHLRQTDEEHTVIMVQVENEMGILGSDRDYSPEADAAFAGTVPALLTERLQLSGTWQEAFGDYAAEAFMAWHYATATEYICSAGKARLPLPMYVNTWLEQAPWIPGRYPSGGPQYKNARIWKAAAPSIDIMAPDIYVTYFQKVCQEYATPENALFIPETRVEAACYLYALGEHNALGFAPFGLEDCAVQTEETDARTLEILQISDSGANRRQLSGQLLGQAYLLTAPMTDMIHRAHAQGRIRGFLYTGEPQERITLPGADLCITYEHTQDSDPTGGGLAIALGDGVYLVMAVNCALTLESRQPGWLLDTIGKEEGTYQDGQWVRGRILNGDERYRNVFGNEVTMIRLEMLAYEDA
ncbi:MAG: DUF5597 domain-containing protein [Clostridia bacterium]|nr:DUF5597 domain-containing protein [Clostridia bacterium]